MLYVNVNIILCYMKGITPKEWIDIERLKLIMFVLHQQN